MKRKQESKYICIELNLNQKKIMNNYDLLIVFVLSQGAGKTKEKAVEAELLSDCLHLIKVNETRELKNYLF